jgi:hypothetical protein
MKRILVAAVLACLATSAFALDFSIGAGAAYDLTTWGDFKGNLLANSVEIKEEIKPVDVKAFVDATYLQISVGYMFFNGGNGITIVNGSSTTTSLTGSMSYVAFAAYVKYPIMLGTVAFFPLAGVEYKLNLTYKDSNGNNLKSSLTSQQQSDLNELWIEGGVGADFSLGQFYVRPEVVVGFKPLSKTDNNVVTTFQGAGYTSTSFTYFTINLNLLAGFKI